MRASRRNRSTASSSSAVACGQDLDGDQAAEPHVLRPVDDAHTAGAELVEDSVLAERLANE